MAKLSSFKTNSRAIREGEWIDLPEYGDVQIFCRGFTDAYTDAVKLRFKRAAAKFGGNEDRLPASAKREINVECLIEFVVRDVRNLEGDNGEQVGFAEFCQLLRDPDYEQLILAVIVAANQVGQVRQAEREEAADPLA